MILFGSERSFVPFQPPRLTVGGYAPLDPFIPCMVCDRSRTDEVFAIVHEYVHVLFDAPRVPPWLSEGAYDALGRAIVEQPDASPKAVAILGTLVGRVGRVDEAEPLLRRVTAAEPEDGRRDRPPTRRMCPC